MASPFSKSEADYRAESDHRTLSEAEQIHNDHGRMKGVRAHHAKVSKIHRSLGAALGRPRSPRKR